MKAEKLASVTEVYICSLRDPKRKFRNTKTKKVLSAKDLESQMRKETRKYRRKNLPDISHQLPPPPEDMMLLQEGAVVMHRFLEPWEIIGPQIICSKCGHHKWIHMEKLGYSGKENIGKCNHLVPGSDETTCDCTKFDGHP